MTTVHVVKVNGVLTLPKTFFSVKIALWFCVHTMEFNGVQWCLVVLKNIFFRVLQKKEMNTGLR